MKLGVSVTDFSWPAPTSEIGPRVARIARRVDEAGFDSLWTMDHFFQIPILGAPPEDPMLEAYSTLAFMAAQTSRVQVGTLVTSVPYRHPGVLVKIVTSLDVLTGGRAVFGVGAGAPSTAMALQHEAGGLGIPFPSLAERFERLEEQLQIAHQMWRGDETPYAGRHYRLHRPLNSPNSVRRPHPPILIGGSGEQKTLRLVARYADACNLFDIPGSRFQDDLARKLRVLRAHCEEVGRDYDEIEKTTATLVAEGEDPGARARALVGHLHELAEIGIDHAIVPGHDEALLDALAGVLPEVHAIPTRPAVLDR
ncbi:MAG: LLM class F420-dependent oxidoreductase [Candidatus Dormibacteraeota bacterium]|nr:LLM class F420-dependent oxidoreductase [Candidatus Dormibacteraeota bacterium]MBO0761306.1 LLM class F420-dependent oxidoreductase [Candidatus Dormibacteraeota bacterium]